MYAQQRLAEARKLERELGTILYVEKKDTSVTGNGELIRDPIAYWGPGSGSPTWQTVSTLGLVGLTAYGVGVAKEEFTQAETTTQPLLRTRRKRKGIMGLGLAALGVALMLPIPVDVTRAQEVWTGA